MLCHVMAVTVLDSMMTGAGEGRSSTSQTKMGCLIAMLGFALYGITKLRQAQAASVSGMTKRSEAPHGVQYIGMDLQRH